MMFTWRYTFLKSEQIIQIKLVMLKIDIKIILIFESVIFFLDSQLSCIIYYLQCKSTFSLIFELKYVVCFH